MTSDVSTVSLRIKEVAYPGKGVGRLEGGCVVFVPGVLEGEEVAVRLVKRKKNFAEGVVEKITTPSPHRVTPACPLADSCPGCRYQHAAYAEELRIKQAQFLGLFRKLAGLDISSLCAEPVGSTECTGYRNKLTLHADVRNGRTALGYFADDNRTVFDVPACPLGLPALNALLHRRRTDPAFMSELQTHDLITLRCTDKDGALCWAGRNAPQKPWLTESSALGDFRVPRGSFFQVNRGVADRLVADVAERIKSTGAESVLDLYCGVGVFAVAARLAGVRQVAGVDLDPEAIEAAAANGSAHGFNDIRLIAAPAHEAVYHVMQRFTPEATALVVDPPRMGLERGMVDELARCRPAHIIYVSCAPDTLARDVKLLGAHGYHLTGARLLDMFPRTPHFESVTMMQRSPN